MYGISIVGVTSVGYVVGGPYEGKKSIGCSLVVDNGKLMSEGNFNEFASELIITELEIRDRVEKGTDIGKMLINKGYNFDGLI